MSKIIFYHESIILLIKMFTIVGNLATNIMPIKKEKPIISSDIYILGETLEQVDLRSNDIYGTIPKEVENLTLLSLFDIRNNHLEGTLPDGLFHYATGLEILRVSHNYFTGTIAELRLSQLRELKIGFNNFTGNVTEIFGDYPKLGT